MKHSIDFFTFGTMTDHIGGINWGRYLNWNPVDTPSISSMPSGISNLEGYTAAGAKSMTGIGTK